MIVEHRHQSLAALNAALLAWSQPLLLRALQQQPRISLLLSGGNTPLPYYRELARAVLPWQQIQLALVDERWVEPTHAASNERAIAEAFTGNSEALSNMVGMKTPDASAAAALAQCNARYAQLPWPPALCVLGMGADGHTASLFPQAAGLQEALESRQRCAAIMAQQSAVTGDHVERMTLTLHALLQSRHIALVFSGQQKWQVYQQARQARDALLPVSLVLHGAASLDVFWCE